MALPDINPARIDRRRRFLRRCSDRMRAMTLARATDRIESARLVLRRIAAGDLPAAPVALRWSDAAAGA
jgi:hypothetical protein